MGVIYFVVMSAGAFGFRVAPSGWRPTGWTAPAERSGKAMITRRQVHLERAWKTPQFWLLWAVLCLNVTAGIGVISMASPMFQDVFGAPAARHRQHRGDRRGADAPGSSPRPRAWSA